jgi:hypothetical protein
MAIQLRVENSVDMYEAEMDKKWNEQQQKKIEEERKHNDEKKLEDELLVKAKDILAHRGDALIASTKVSVTQSMTHSNSLIARSIPLSQMVSARRVRRRTSFVRESKGGPAPSVLRGTPIKSYSGEDPHQN